MRAVAGTRTMREPGGLALEEERGERGGAVIPWGWAGRGLGRAARMPAAGNGGEPAWSRQSPAGELRPHCLTLCRFPACSELRHQVFGPGECHCKIEGGDERRGTGWGYMHVVSAPVKLKGERRMREGVLAG